MSDPDPSDPVPSGRLRKMFGFGRKGHDAEHPSEPSQGEPTVTPHDMRLRIVEFEQLRVEDVMVARAEVKAVEVGTEFPELLKYFAEVTHSRLPVFRESLDDPIGFVHIKDVVKELATGGEMNRRPLERLHREVLYVPPSMKLTDLLVKMQSTRIHLGLVVDEYGGTDGLVSLEDLVEEIVGDIEDEHDDEEPMFVRRSQRVWEADARTEIDDFAEETGIDLELPDMETDIDTLGGVVFALAGKVPVRGEVLRHPSGVEIEVMDADARRIRRLRLRTPETGAASIPQE
ncbi:MAG: CBS domain-containing protein [Alphaproteobacteria bacterium]|nr:CBS domain-containing protein [Alphaproteobacteria bacterium]MBU2084659.1 CBS domain-containing protein [Alphaproteobacteria bacterium]MBU2141930.1 CBS domain-containing protein [Alphaproteobacteria bacterium]MBU2198378.1 CBS domain-containing protein [Alphaproteobacteria bacterium]